MVLSDIGQQVTEAIGLNFASLGSTALESAVRQRQAACGLDSLTAYREKLRHSPAEWQHLVETLVVPETWFFRDPATFAALTRFTRGRLQHGGGRLLRLLSLPCSTGEEPYSMAMALLDAGIPATGFRIDAVDISRRAIARAEQALYGSNSFRGGDPASRRRYFTAVEGAYQLADHVRGQVRFQAGNLCADDLLPDADRYDVVFCRNLLIYFDAAALDRAARALGRLLAPDGLLVVASSEISVVARRGLVPLGCSARASTHSTSASRPAAGATRPAPPRSSVGLRTGRSERGGTRDDTPVRPPEPATSAGDLQSATHLADQGSYAEAAAHCEAHVREHGASPAACYLLGLVRDAMGDLPGAARHYRQTLYLDPNHHDALSHYSLLLERQGDASRAQVLKARARRLQAAGTV